MPLRLFGGRPLPRPHGRRAGRAERPLRGLRRGARGARGRAARSGSRRTACRRTRCSAAPRSSRLSSPRPPRPVSRSSCSSSARAPGLNLLVDRYRYRYANGICGARRRAARADGRRSTGVGFPRRSSSASSSSAGGAGSTSRRSTRRPPRATSCCGASSGPGSKTGSRGSTPRSRRFAHARSTGADRGRLREAAARVPRRPTRRRADRRLRHVLDPLPPRGGRARAWRARSRPRRADGRPLAWVSVRRWDMSAGPSEAVFELELRVWPGAARRRRARRSRMATGSTGGSRDHGPRQRDAQARPEAARRNASTATRPGFSRRRARTWSTRRARPGSSPSPAHRRGDGRGGAARPRLDAATPGPGDRRLPPRATSRPACATCASRSGACRIRGTSARSCALPTPSARPSRSRRAAPTRCRRRRSGRAPARSSASRLSHGTTRPGRCLALAPHGGTPLGDDRPLAAGDLPSRLRARRAADDLATDCCKVTIPLPGGAESLNVAAAGAIALYAVSARASAPQ